VFADRLIGKALERVVVRLLVPSSSVVLGHLPVGFMPTITSSKPRRQQPQTLIDSRGSWWRAIRPPPGPGKSMSWAKSVLPAFAGGSSEKFRIAPNQVQIDTIDFRPQAPAKSALSRTPLAVNRTAVWRSFETGGATQRSLS
jgi:hypothetical protein